MVKAHKLAHLRVHRVAVTGAPARCYFDICFRMLPPPKLIDEVPNIRQDTVSLRMAGTTVCSVTQCWELLVFKFHCRWRDRRAGLHAWITRSARRRK